MIFEEIIEEQSPKIKKAVGNLFKKAENNQTHPQDLLLIASHGFQKDKFGKNILIGPGEIGYAEQTQYEFYDWYRKSHMEKLSEFNSEKEDNESLKYAEKISINLEKSMYLKFWESNMIIKKMKQLVNLANGKNYDFFFKIPAHNRAGSKQEIIRKQIRDETKDLCPKFYNILKETYLTQIRNAIAHSQYYISEKNIVYLNYSNKKKAHCPINSLNFKEWAYYIHNTFLIYNELIRNINNIKEKYYQKTKDKEYIEVRFINENGSKENKKLGLRNDDIKEWVWYDNLKQ